jgi:methylmalonyl-CoA mutase cobalamin-binding subunit
VEPLHDLTCVVHVHSTHSDGTGTVAEIAAAAARNAVDVVLLTDHDTLAARRAGEEGWHGDVLVLVGEEVTPKDRDHYLAFGLDREVSRNQPAAGIVSDVVSRGGFGFVAHPFSQGSPRFSRIRGMPWTDFDCGQIEGLEVWSFVTDMGEKLESLADVARFIAVPERVIDHPPEHNLAEWDRLCRLRRVVGIAGIDAHQIGIRVRGRVPLRLMSYARSFRYLRTHVLCEEPLNGELEHDRDQVFGALREGRCYMSVDSLGPPRGFTFSAGDLAMGAEAAFDRQTLRATTPRPAPLRLIHNGQQIAGVLASELVHPATEPGVYRVEAHLGDRAWILSNPIYLR